MKQHQIVNTLYFIGAMLAVLLVRDLWVQQQRVDQIPYSEFRYLLKAGMVAEVAVGDTYIRGRLAQPSAGEKPEFVTSKLALDVADFLARYKVKYKAEHDSSWLKAILSWVVPTALFLGIWMFIIRRMQT